MKKVSTFCEPGTGQIQPGSKLGLSICHLHWYRCPCIGRSYLEEPIGIPGLTKGCIELLNRFRTITRQSTIEAFAVTCTEIKPLHLERSQAYFGSAAVVDS